jgi:hypothetical protein
MGARLAILAGVLALVTAIPAAAVTNGDGDLRARFEGGILPTRLPRDTPVPVSVTVAGDVSSASGDDANLPQLTRIAVAINRQGVLFDRGLPVCRPSSIRTGNRALGRQACGGAIVGRGHVTVQVRIPGQLPFLVHAEVLAFNGPRRGGRKLILAQAYARRPPGSFILTFRVSRRSGAFGTVLTTRLPPSTRGWAYLTHFDLTLHRTYLYRGQRRSFVSAACPAPPGFRRIPFPFAEATFDFENGQRLSMSQAGVCRVAGSPVGGY